MKTWKLLPVLAAALLAAAPASAQDWALPRLNKSPRHLEMIDLKHDDRVLKGFIGYPAAKDKVPAVLIIHEIYGLSNWAKSAVDEFAEAGYIALAPDLLWGKGPGGAGTEALGSQSAVTSAIPSIPPDQITADLKAAVAYLQKDTACNGQIFVVGFCWGGGQTYRFASNSKDLEAAFIFYGPKPDPIDILGRIDCPVYGFFGELDGRVTTGVPDVVKEMKADKKTFEPVIYAGAKHGFMRAGDGDPAGSAEDKTARADGWKRMMDLMKTISAAPKAAGDTPKATTSGPATTTTISK